MLRVLIIEVELDDSDPETWYVSKRDLLGQDSSWDSSVMWVREWDGWS